MRTLLINGKHEPIPPFPHPRDYVWRCSRFFGARSLLSFMAVARFHAFRELFNSWRYRCGIPRDILIDPTNACNLRCIGCWSHDYDQTCELSLDKLDQICAEARKLGTLDILLTGGEPMLRRNDILELARHHRRLFFGLFTNGTLIDESFVTTIEQLGNVTVFISIEGYREETDFRRGQGTYDRAIRAMRLLHQHGIAFGFSLCYHKMNYQTVTSDAFLDFLRQEGAWFGWAFAYRPIGRDADMSLCLNAEQRELARTRLDDYSHRNQMTIIDLFNSGHQAYGCVAAGSGYLHIAASGDVEPCAFCHYADSNLHDVNLQEALQSPFFRAFRRAQPFSDNPLQPCPMIDQPDAIVRLTEAHGARSTHQTSPESARQFADKIRPYASEWNQHVRDKSRPYPRSVLKRYQALRKILQIRKRLAGDMEDPSR